MIGSPEEADGHETNVIGEPSRLLPVASSFSSFPVPRAIVFSVEATRILCFYDT